MSATLAGDRGVRDDVDGRRFPVPPDPRGNPIDGAVSDHDGVARVGGLDVKRSHDVGSPASEADFPWESRERRLERNLAARSA